MMHMYCWSYSASFVAVAQASCVAEARGLILAQIGRPDGSCPEREKAIHHIKNNTPSVWHGPNAEFALTDSAELREADAYRETLEARIRELEAKVGAMA